MKKLIVLGAILVSTIAMAQEHHEKREMRGPEHKRMMHDFTPEQMADLKTKKLTLALDLSEKQQKEVLKLNTDLAKKHKEMFDKMKAKKESGKEKTPPTADERYAMASARLDEQITLKNKMRTILTDDQYKKWTEIKEHRRDMAREGFKKHFKHKNKKGDWHPAPSRD